MLCMLYIEILEVQGIKDDIPILRVSSNFVFKFFHNIEYKSEPFSLKLYCMQQVNTPVKPMCLAQSTGRPSTSLTDNWIIKSSRLPTVVNRAVAGELHGVVRWGRCPLRYLYGQGSIFWTSRGGIIEAHKAGQQISSYEKNLPCQWRTNKKLVSITLYEVLVD